MERRTKRLRLGPGTLALTVIPALVGCPSGDPAETPAPTAASTDPVGPPSEAPMAPPSTAPVAAPDRPTDVGVEPGPAAPLEGAGVLSSDGTYWLVYRLQPEDVPLNELFSIEVAVHDADDRTVPLRDVELTVDGRMPDHRHGMNREPRITRDPHGRFEISGMLFHMPGYWELHLDVTRGWTTERALVEIELE